MGHSSDSDVGCRHHGSDCKTCVCKKYGYWSKSEIIGSIIALMVVPIVLGVIMWGSALSLEYKAFIGFNAPMFFSESAAATLNFAALLLAAIALAILLCKRNQTLIDAENHRKWRQWFWSTLLYMLLTGGCWLAYYHMDSVKLAGIFALAALLVAIFFIGRGFNCIRSRTASVIFVVSVICNFLYFCFAVVNWN